MSFLNSKGGEGGRKRKGYEEAKLFSYLVFANYTFQKIENYVWDLKRAKEREGERRRRKASIIVGECIQ